MKYLLFLAISLCTNLIHAQAGMDKMKQYYFVLLTKGPHRDQDSITADKIQAAHMANIQRLATEGKLIVAGPFMDDGEWRGIFIFDAKDAKEVEAMLKTDMAVSSGRLRYEIHPWLTEKGTCFK